MHNNRGVRIAADYQLMSDDPGEQWMTGTLEHAKQIGLIANFKVTGSYVGEWGLQYVTFSVDIPLRENTSFPPNMSYDQCKELADNLLNGPVVPDSDVQVRWVSPIELA